MEIFFIVIVILITAVIGLRIYLNQSVACGNKNRLDGKIVVITGATSGIGKEVAVECARRGADVVLACRNQAKAEEVATEIIRTTGNQKVSFLQLELASMESVRQFVRSFKERHDTIYILINNAGYLGAKASTVDGFDYCFQVNFLAHFHLTQLLVSHFMDWRRKSSSSTSILRVINLASNVYVDGKLDVTDDTILLPNDVKYDIYEAYATLKLATILFTKELNLRLSADGVASMAVHPGPVRTGLFDNWPGIFGRLLRFAALVLFRSQKVGSETVIHCATATVDDVTCLSGKLLLDCDVVAVKSMAQDGEKARRLWGAAEAMCRTTVSDDRP